MCKRQYFMVGESRNPKASPRASALHWPTGLESHLQSSVLSLMCLCLCCYAREQTKVSELGATLADVCCSNRAPQDGPPLFLNSCPHGRLELRYKDQLAGLVQGARRATECVGHGNKSWGCKSPVGPLKATTS